MSVLCLWNVLKNVQEHTSIYIDCVCWCLSFCFIWVALRKRILAWFRDETWQSQAELASIAICPLRATGFLTYCIWPDRLAKFTFNFQHSTIISHLLFISIVPLKPTIYNMLIVHNLIFRYTDLYGQQNEPRL